MPIKYPISIPFPFIVDLFDRTEKREIITISASEAEAQDFTNERANHDIAHPKRIKIEQQKVKSHALFETELK